MDMPVGANHETFTWAGTHKPAMQILVQAMSALAAEAEIAEARAHVRAC
jgi:hypothetical protein